MNYINNFIDKEFTTKELDLFMQKKLNSKLKSFDQKRFDDLCNKLCEYNIYIYDTDANYVDNIINYFLYCGNVMTLSNFKNIIAHSGMHRYAITYIDQMINQKVNFENDLLEIINSSLYWNGGGTSSSFDHVVKYLIDINVKPSEDILLLTCKRLGEVAVQSVTTKIKPNIKCFTAILNNHCIKNKNILFNNFKFANCHELYTVNEMWNKINKIDIVQAVENIDEDCIRWCLKNSIKIPTNYFKDNKFDIKFLKDACFGSNLKILKDFISKFNVKFDTECLENACYSGNKKIIDYILEFNIPITDKCIYNYAKNTKNVYMDKLLDIKNKNKT
ncbi:MAG: hypothetical protein Edafosvirus1_68 [Edafosvirus sp.]|uniref:Ankyrin repeat protein n=1 Tax=Edafosvirus sp. TaxID=2487765 RepID=A0A3G4ZS56_9VIRU|nr:MAG: hypothetical protein Edafosvirus1_68 [Edafosvirus sp.]